MGTGTKGIAEMPITAPARDGDREAFRTLVEPFRRELRAHCYRMAGAIDEADDLLQESLLRAWHALPEFEGRSSLRTWLYRVTTNVCIDRLKHRAARKRAEDVGPAADAAAAIPDPVYDGWIGPCPALLDPDQPTSPEARVSASESVAFAFLAALQLLSPNQRATLIACDVLGMSADECADILDMSAASVYSALQRARETVARRRPNWTPLPPKDARTRALLARYMDAWTNADEDALVGLLHSDASMAMPPIPIWLHGPAAIAGSIGAMVFSGCRANEFRMIETEANGLAAVAVYRRGPDDAYLPYALHVLAIDDDSIRTLTAFLDVRIFDSFNLPPRA